MNVYIPLNEYIYHNAVVRVIIVIASTNGIASFALLFLLYLYNFLHYNPIRKSQGILITWLFIK